MKTNKSKTSKLLLLTLGSALALDTGLSAVDARGIVDNMAVRNLRRRYKSEGQGLLTETNNNGEIPLFYHLKKDHEDAVRFLIVKGSNLSAKDSEGDTPLISMVNREDVKMIQLLLQVAKLNGTSINLNEKGKDGNTALHVAAAKNNLFLVEMLILNGAKDSLHMLNNYGQSPLMLAVDNENIPMVKFLIAQGSDIRKDDAAGTVFHHAANKGNAMLISAIADSYKIRSLNSILEFDDCAYGRVVTEKLDSQKREQEANELIRVVVNIPNLCNQTALHVASNAACIEKLIQLGADRNLKDDTGMIAQEYWTQKVEDSHWINPFRVGYAINAVKLAPTVDSSWVKPWTWHKKLLTRNCCERIQEAKTMEESSSIYVPNKGKGAFMDSPPSSPIHLKGNIDFGANIKLQGTSLKVN